MAPRSCLQAVRFRRASECGRPRSGIDPRLALSITLLLAVVACSSGDEGLPSYVPLSELVPTRDLARQIPSVLSTWNAHLDFDTPLRARPAGEDDALWIERVVAPGQWIETGIPGLWRTPRVLVSHGQPADGSSGLRLVRDGRDLAFLTDRRLVEVMRKTAHKSEVTPDTFFEFRGDLYVGLEGAPNTMTHRVFLRLDGVVNGRRRVAQKRFAGDGFAVLPGMSMDLSLDVDRARASNEARTLRVATVSQGDLVALAEDAAPVRFRITLDGEPLLEHEQPASPGGEVHRHVLALPPTRSGTLRFEVDGPPALTAFLHPILGPPAAVPEQVEQAEQVDRVKQADVVLFLADTFRADNMRLYGSPVDVTPHLDAFAADSVRYLRTWSPASWTLPAHASLFSGVYPFQHDALERSFALEQAAVTLAEQLAAAGYRTGAVTDALLVSHANGLDQGFEWWDEHAVDLPDTLRRVKSFLEADDGRPVFLFVHTYAIHTPYTVSEQTRSSHADRLDLGHEIADLLRDIRGGEDAEPRTPAARKSGRAKRRYHDLYRGAVADLDRGFGDFLTLLEDHGLDRSGYTIFTSDHGEAFGEHGHLGHGAGVWEEDVRIPLLVRGPDLAPADVSWAASLMDLPRTIAALTGTEPAPGWLGASLLGVHEERPVFSFQARRRADLTTRIAMIHGSRKLITLGKARTVGEIDAVYDLGADPAELDNLVDAAPDWFDALERRLLPLARALLVPVYAANDQALTPDQMEDLQALGYADF